MLFTRPTSALMLSKSFPVPILNLKWIDLNINANELRLENTLVTGQCFNWKRININDRQSILQGEKFWTGVLFGKPLILRQSQHTTSFVSLFDLCESEEENLIEKLKDYFQIGHSLSSLYLRWSSQCERMKSIAKSLKGVRVLRQDPWECLVSFICSSNNNISRITLMLDRLRSTFGDYLCTMSVSVKNNMVEVNIFESPSNTHSYDREEVLPDSVNVDLATSKQRKKRQRDSSQLVENETLANTEDAATECQIFTFHTFPSAEQLLSVSEQQLRLLGMGYRAKFLKESAHMVHSKQGGSDGWFQYLRSKASGAIDLNIAEQNKVRLEIQNALLDLPGVGRKVADCVAVFSLDQVNAIPVDIHVWSIAVRDYNPELAKRKSLTPTVYEEVGDAFRSRFSENAGWAHSVLFAAELPSFRGCLPTSLQEDMKAFADKQKMIKKLKKQEKDQQRKEKTP